MIEQLPWYAGARFGSSDDLLAVRDTLKAGPQPQDVVRVELLPWSDGGVRIIGFAEGWVWFFHHGFNGWDPAHPAAVQWFTRVWDGEADETLLTVAALDEEMCRSAIEPIRKARAEWDAKMM